MLFLLRNGDEDQRIEALVGLLDAGTSDGLVPMLTATLEEDTPLARTLAAMILGRHPEAAVPAVPALTDCLEDPATRDAALFALGRIGAGAASAVEAVETLLQHSDESVRQRAEKVLERIRP